MRFLVLILIFSFLLAPQRSMAVANEHYVNSLFSLIESLEKMVRLLEGYSTLNQNAVVQSASSHSSIDATKSRYHDGRYDAVYPVKEGVLLASQIPLSHRTLWNMFIDVVGQNHILKSVSEFRVYTDRNAEYDAFVERIGLDNSWVLGINVYDLDLTKNTEIASLYELLIHEYAHIVFSVHKEVVSDFEERFWSPHDTKGVWQEDKFVSDYATTDPLEDAAESLVHFVMKSIPSGTSKRDQKIRFFLAHPAVVEIRDNLQSIRENYGEL